MVYYLYNVMWMGTIMSNERKFESPEKSILIGFYNALTVTDAQKIYTHCLQNYSPEEIANEFLCLPLNTSVAEAADADKRKNTLPLHTAPCVAGSAMYYKRYDVSLFYLSKGGNLTNNGWDRPYSIIHWLNQHLPDPSLFSQFLYFFLNQEKKKAKQNLSKIYILLL